MEPIELYSYYEPWCYDNFPLSHYINELHITELTDYLNLESHSVFNVCSEESYYECLLRQFLNHNFSQDTINTKNYSNCNFSKICIPFSLPTSLQAQEKYSMCSDNQTRLCFESVLFDIERDQQKYCRKTCEVKEFIVRQSHRNPDCKEEGPVHKNQFVLEYDFEVPKATRDMLSRNPYKTLKTERLVTSGITLVGNVGGTLGMFVGFSFIATSEWLAIVFTGFLTRTNLNCYGLKVLFFRFF